MPYKLRDGLPSSKANTVELADFIEFECLKKEDLTFATLDIIKTLNAGDDYQEDEVDEFNFLRDSMEEPRVDDAMNEIETRLSYCDAKYPFTIIENKVVYQSVNPQTNIIYIFLLLATRLHMGGKNAEKVFSNLDGTLLFEHLCEVVLRNYWGKDAETCLFGTSAGNRFEDKVAMLITGMKEGRGFKNLDALSPTENDGSLDVAVWKSFTDGRQSKLIGFAQCKTGDTWRPEIGKLNPSRFTDTWFIDPPALTPINTFMISDVVRDYYIKTTMSLLFFDRCRIMDYLPTDIEESLLDNLSTWVIDALSSYGIDHTNLNIEIPTSIH